MSPQTATVDSSSPGTKQYSRMKLILEFDDLSRLVIEESRLSAKHHYYFEGNIAEILGEKAYRLPIPKSYAEKMIADKVNFDPAIKTLLVEVLSSQAWTKPLNER